MVWRPINAGQNKKGFLRGRPCTRRAASSWGRYQDAFQARPTMPIRALSSVSRLARPTNTVVVGMKYMPTLKLPKSPMKATMLRRESR